MEWNSRRVAAILESALLEDKAAQDVTTALTIDPALRATGTIFAKEPCVIAGLGCIPAFLSVFNKLSTKPGQTASRFEVVSHPEVFDGVRVKKGQPIAVIRANAVSILSTERVILNLIQRMSGIATLTSEFVQAVTPKPKGNAKSKGQPKPLATIVDTRKTTPGLRILDKYAVCCGGGSNRRLDLQERILIKSNHISVGGGLPAVLAKALERRKPAQYVQVEVRTPEELAQAISGHADSILLDKWKPKDLRKAVAQIRQGLPSATIEASGDITLKTVRSYAKTGVDFISVGALTHSAAAIDLSMRIVAAQ